MDCISANPVTANEFATGSHDRTIKIWDLNKPDQSIKTLSGNKEGIWCINYHKNGKELISASPEGIAKIWDIKAGKSTAELKYHTKRVFWATYNNAGTHAATCGSDRILAYWDLRKTATPLHTNTRKLYLSYNIFRERYSDIVL